MNRTRSQSRSQSVPNSPKKSSPQKKRIIINLSKTRKSSTTIEEEEETITKTVKETKKTTIIKKKIKRKKKVELVITTNALRPRKGMKFIWRENNEDEDAVFEELDSPAFIKKKRKKRVKTEFLEEKAYTKRYTIEDDEDIYEEETAPQKEHIEEALDKIPKNKKQLKTLYDKVNEKIDYYKNQFILEQEELGSTLVLGKN